MKYMQSGEKDGTSRTVVEMGFGCVLILGVVFFRMQLK